MNNKYALHYPHVVLARHDIGCQAGYTNEPCRRLALEAGVNNVNQEKTPIITSFTSDIGNES